MTSVVIAMLVCVAAAALVLALVAVPRLRGGAKVLTPDGRDALDDATRRARAMAARSSRPGAPGAGPDRQDPSDVVDLRDEDADLRRRR